MEYVTPPRAALVLLNFFASEPDLADVLGDLSEEFQRCASAHGHPAAKRWYWREAFRNSRALGTRELLRTPGTVLVVSLLTALGIPRVLASVVGPLTQKVQWGWIPNRFWLWYHAVSLILIPLLFYVGSGALVSRLVRAREFALAVAFATVSTFGVICTLWILRYSSARGRLPMGVSLSQLSERVLLEWATVVIAYSLGCFWIRWCRLTHRSYLAR
jgi:hypothetical protein